MIRGILRKLLNYAYGFDLESLNPSKPVDIYYYNTKGVVPYYASDGAVGADLVADLEGKESIILHPGDSIKISTGTVIELPPFYEARVCSRSGLSGDRQLLLLNGVGVVDWDFRGTMKLPVKNISDQIIEIKDGDRIAQVVISRVVRVNWKDIISKSLFSETDRGEQGFGHTGK